MNTNLIKPHHENFTEANKVSKDQFFVNFVAICRVPLWIAILVLPALGVQASVVLTTLHSFDGTNDGGYPSAALAQGSDGNLYGTTTEGTTNNLGTNNDGTIFKISINGAFDNLHSFGGNGANPNGLVQGSDGYFYGTTEFGENGYGNAFKIGTNGSLTSLYSFTGGTNGEIPATVLVQGSDGYFYGTTAGHIKSDSSRFIMGRDRAFRRRTGYGCGSFESYGSPARWI